jgi:hypothetical protein
MSKKMSLNEELLTREELKRLEYLLPRLKYSITLSDLLSWLDNFEKDDQKLAYDLLLVLEFITFNELQYRFDDLLKQIFKDIPKNENIIILPFGKVGKSGSIITYIIKNTSAFKSRKRKNVDNVLLTHDYKYINARNYNHIIFIDDFIGSGKTFCDEYKNNNDIEAWIFYNRISKVYLLSSIIMKEAQDRIKKRFSYIQIKSDERYKIFDSNTSPLKAFKNLNAIKTMAYKYGKSIRENPYGFESTESLLSFFHGTPNNTLPIIWSAKSNWKPLFPRKSDIKMDIARKEKKEIAFMIGIYNRLAIDLYNKDESIYINTYTGRRREIKYNTHEHFSLIGLIKLKNDGYDDIFICHLLGLTMNELNEIYNKSIKEKLISPSKSITIDGQNFLKEIKRTIRKESFKKETEENLKIKVTYYIPKMFKGKT